MVFFVCFGGVFFFIAAPLLRCLFIISQAACPSLMLHYVCLQFVVYVSAVNTAHCIRPARGRCRAAPQNPAGAKCMWGTAQMRPAQRWDGCRRMPQCDVLRLLGVFACNGRQLRAAESASHDLPQGHQAKQESSGTHRGGAPPDLIANTGQGAYSQCNRESRAIRTFRSGVGSRFMSTPRRGKPAHASGEAKRSSATHPTHPREPDGRFGCDDQEHACQPGTGRGQEQCSGAAAHKCRARLPMHYAIGALRCWPRPVLLVLGQLHEMLAPSHPGE